MSSLRFRRARCKNPRAGPFPGQRHDACYFGAVQQRHAPPCSTQLHSAIACSMQPPPRHRGRIPAPVASSPTPRRRACHPHQIASGLVNIGRRNAPVILKGSRDRYPTARRRSQRIRSTASSGAMANARGRPPPRAAALMPALCDLLTDVRAHCRRILCDHGFLRSPNGARATSMFKCIKRDSTAAPRQVGGHAGAKPASRSGTLDDSAQWRADTALT